MRSIGMRMDILWSNALSCKRFSTYSFQLARQKSFLDIHPRPKNQNPVLFRQVVVHSDGSTFKIQSTSPKSLLTLTKDTVNHPLWNVFSTVIDDQTGELAKFNTRFGDLQGLDLTVAKPVEVKKKPVVVVEEVKPVTKGKKKK